MRRLTLILSDLYLPDEAAAGAVPQAASLPSLDWLLRFSDAPRRIEDWRHWLLTELGGAPARRSLAALVAESAGVANAALIATPVHLHARIDHVRLVDRGLLRIPADERLAWREEFTRVFGPQYTLHEMNERAFLLTGLARTEVRTTDPARVLGAEVGPALPSSGAGELRRLWSEIEMWLHGAPLNDQRERAGRPRVSALWLWGTGPLPDAEPAKRAAHRFHGGDPLIEALAPGRAPRATKLGDVDTSAEHVVAELAPLTGHPDEALSALEANWFAPARAALARPGFECVQVVANDRVFRTTARASFRFWRPRRGWLESLA